MVLDGDVDSVLVVEVTLSTLAFRKIQVFLTKPEVLPYRLDMSLDFRYMQRENLTGVAL